MVEQRIRRLINALKTGKVTRRTIADVFMLRFSLENAPLDDDVLFTLVERLYRLAQRAAKTRPDIALPILRETHKFLKRIQMHYAAQAVVRKAILRLRKQQEGEQQEGGEMKEANLLADLFVAIRRNADYSIAEATATSFRTKVRVPREIEEWDETVPPEVGYTIVNFAEEKLRDLRVENALRGLVGRLGLGEQYNLDEVVWGAQEVVDKMLGILSKDGRSLIGEIKDKVIGTWGQPPNWQEEVRAALSELETFLDAPTEENYTRMAPEARKKGQQLMTEVSQKAVEEGKRIASNLVEFSSGLMQRYFAQLTNLMLSDWKQLMTKPIGLPPQLDPDTMRKIILSIGEETSKIAPAIKEEFATPLQSLFSAIKFAEHLHSIIKEAVIYAGNLEDKYSDLHNFADLLVRQLQQGKETIPRDGGLGHMFGLLLAFLWGVGSVAEGELRRRFYSEGIGEITSRKGMGDTEHWLINTEREIKEILDEILRGYEEWTGRAPIWTRADRKVRIEHTRLVTEKVEEMSNEAITQKMIKARNYFYKLFGGQPTLRLIVKVEPTSLSTRLEEAQHEAAMRRPSESWEELVNATYNFLMRIRGSEEERVQGVFSEQNFSLDPSKVKGQPPPLGHFQNIAERTQELIGDMITGMGLRSELIDEAIAYLRQKGEEIKPTLDALGLEDLEELRARLVEGIDRLRRTLIYVIENAFRFRHIYALMTDWEEKCDLSPDSILEHFISCLKEVEEQAAIKSRQDLNRSTSKAMTKLLRDTVAHSIESVISRWLEVEGRYLYAFYRILSRDIQGKFKFYIDAALREQIGEIASEIVNGVMSQRRKVIDQLLNNTIANTINTEFGVVGKVEEYDVLLSMELSDLLKLGTIEGLDDDSCWWGSGNMSIPAVAGATNVVWGFFNKRGNETLEGRFILYIQGGEFAITNMRIRGGGTQGMVERLSQAIIRELGALARSKGIVPTPANDTNWTLGMPSPTGFEAVIGEGREGQGYLSPQPLTKTLIRIKFPP